MEATRLFVDNSSRNESGDVTLPTGILPAQELLKAIQPKDIQVLEPINDDQVQPASIDLRLGQKAYRVRASFLPGTTSTVKEKLDGLSMHEMDITNGGVLEKGCVYIIPLLEHLHLKYRISARGNP